MERMVIEAHWGYVSLPLKSGTLAEKGKLACIDTAANGVIDKGHVSATLIPFGLFHETLLGDGVKRVHIKLFREIQAVWWVNDTVDAIGPEDVGTFAYIKDDQTVSANASGRSCLGLILAVDPSKGALVYADYPFRPDLT